MSDYSGFLKQILTNLDGLLFNDNHRREGRFKVLYDDGGDVMHIRTLKIAYRSQKK